MRILGAVGFTAAAQPNFLPRPSPPLRSSSRSHPVFDMAKGSQKKSPAQSRDKKPTDRELSTPEPPTPEPPTAPLPLPVAESNPTTSQTTASGSTPFKWPNSPEAQQAPPQTSAPTVKNTTFAYELPTRIATLEDVGEHALNASISFGRFEDLRVLAFSRRIPPDRVGVPRALYANTTLIARALPGLFKGAYRSVCMHLRQWYTDASVRRNR